MVFSVFYIYSDQQLQTLGRLLLAYCFCGWERNTQTHTYMHARLCARPRSIHSRSPHSHMLCKLRWYLLKEKQTLVLVFARLNSQLGEYLPTSKYLHWGVSDSFMDLYFFFNGYTNMGGEQRRTGPPRTKRTNQKNMLRVCVKGTPHWESVHLSAVKCIFTAAQPSRLASQLPSQI